MYFTSMLHKVVHFMKGKEMKIHHSFLLFQIAKEKMLTKLKMERDVLRISSSKCSFAIE